MGGAWIVPDLIHGVFQEVTFALPGYFCFRIFAAKFWGHFWGKVGVVFFAVSPLQKSE